MDNDPTEAPLGESPKKEKKSWADGCAQALMWGVLIFVTVVFLIFGTCTATLR